MAISAATSDIYVQAPFMESDLNLVDDEASADLRLAHLVAEQAFDGGLYVHLREAFYAREQVIARYFLQGDSGELSELQRLLSAELTELDAYLADQLAGHGRIYQLGFVLPMVA